MTKQLPIIDTDFKMFNFYVRQNNNLNDNERFLKT